MEGKVRKGTLGVIIGNRGIFPGSLAEKGREEIVNLLKREGIEAIIVPSKETKYGAIENLQEAKKCAEIFRKNREKIDGILISLPNFGDERAVSDAIKMSELDVPVLVQAYPDELERMQVENRRDSFCGKLSVCSDLIQYEIPFSLTKSHTVKPSSNEFLDDLHSFLGVCRVFKGVRKARIGAIGARTVPFKTVRYSERLLESAGISVEVIDLSEIIMAVQKLGDTEKEVQAKLNSITEYCSTDGVPKQSLLNMAKLGVVIDRWVEENGLNATAIQCWPNLQEALGIFPCTLMSMMNNALLPSACEVDIMGALAMFTLQLASNQPSGLFDWNNNYGDEHNKTVLFHCSNLPKSMLKTIRMEYNAIDANVRKSAEKSYGTCVGRVKSGPLTFARVSTDDVSGRIIGCIGEGEFTDDPLETFGGVGVARIDKLQELLKFLCENGFEHHVAVSQSRVSEILFEAMDNYLGWDIYYHNK